LESLELDVLKSDYRAGLFSLKQLATPCAFDDKGDEVTIAVSAVARTRMG
jgi:hypothetical protein